MGGAKSGLDDATEHGPSPNTMYMITIMYIIVYAIKIQWELQRADASESREYCLFFYLICVFFSIQIWLGG